MALQHEPRVAVVGATGAVGSQIVELLETRAFPQGNLSLFASGAGAESVETENGNANVEELSDLADLRGFALAFLAVPEKTAADIIAARPGPVLIDLSACGRTPRGRSLVSPGIVTRERLLELRGSMVFETPHPAAHAIASIMAAVGGDDAGPFGAILLTGASARGREQVADVAQQSADFLSGRFHSEEEGVQHGFNLFAGDHERSLAKIILAQLTAMTGRTPNVALQTSTAPILHGSVLALQFPAAQNLDRWPDRLRGAPGIVLVEGEETLGVADVLGQEAIVTRFDRAGDRSATIFAAFDNTRLAALIATWIAENLLQTSH